MMIFNQQQKLADEMNYTGDLRLMPQFFRASAEFAYRLGGEFYRGLLDRIQFEGRKYISIDSRVHMLMTGMYPCIPGWHCDDFFRPEGQPDLERLPPMTHWATILGDCSRTEFIWEPVELPSPIELWEVFRSDRPLYAYYNEMVEKLEPAPRKRMIEPGEIIRFSGLDFHRGTAATHNGWRAFIRVTESDHWEPKDELRTQTQVYLTEPFLGW